MTPAVPTIATRQQVARWAKLKQQAADIGDLQWCLRQLNINAAIAYNFAKRSGLNAESPEPLEKSLIDQETRLNRIKTAMDRVDARVWGLQFRNGDLDIIEPQADFGVGVLLVVAGVVAVAALGAALYAMWQEAKETHRKYNALLVATDRALCTSPESCADWEKTKTEMGYQKRQGIVDSALESIGTAATTGTKWGLAAAVPIALIALLMWRRK